MVASHNTVAKILSQKSHPVPGKLRVTEWFFEVPKDYSEPTQGTIRLFARSAERVEKPADSTKGEKKHQPWFAYLQGGPGFGCRSSFSSPYSILLDKGYKVLLLDQRGTGMSNTITSELLQKLGGPQQQVDYLQHFRADNIVNDFEAVRKALTADYPEEKKKWSILGQSFGGFCAVNYLSRRSEGLREVFTTGGLPPLLNQPDPIYRRLCTRAAAQSHEYYAKFPEDVKRMQQLADYLAKNEVKTFTGGKLTPSKLRALGIGLGFSGGFEDVHNLLVRMENDLDLFGSLTRPTINSFDSKFAFDDAVLYALLHEPIYTGGHASNWSAERILNETEEFKSYDGSSLDPIMFTTEMITKSMFEDMESLIPLKETSELLAQKDDWPDLFDEEQLAKNEVPVYAAQYYDDLYVDIDYAVETAKKIKGTKLFITNTLYHDAVRSNAEQVMRELFALRDDVRD